MKKRPSIERVRHFFNFDKNGSLVRTCPCKGRNLDGSVGSTRANGYVRVKIDYMDIYAHHIVWALSYGEWPESDIDHINCNRSDNRVENLRLATKKQNQGNKCKKAGKTLPKGVQHVARTGRYQAFIQSDRKSCNLGTFDTPDDASRAYAAAARRVFGEFARAA